MRIFRGGTSLNEEMREFDLPLMLDCLEKTFYELC